MTRLICEVVSLYHVSKLMEVMLLLIIKVILADITFRAILNSLGSMQFKHVDVFPSIHEKKEISNEQMIRGISSETSSVTFELMKVFSFSNFENFSGCLSFDATFIKSSLK